MKVDNLLEGNTRKIAYEGVFEPSERGSRYLQQQMRLVKKLEKY